MFSFMLPKMQNQSRLETQLALCHYLQKTRKMMFYYIRGTGKNLSKFSEIHLGKSWEAGKKKDFNIKPC